ncbi:thymidylate synthase [Desulfoluna spongiiphila]|uniref:Thymidylate synthase n=1 Tax=Desulfoluna spongiiphila TaxID=419481 RepID=A0A1G5JSF9_9BACT|nr:thymidylate synthase [Desulfoluna spongiiphila]SCY90589.1 thymidylate synthase [Desulfoluna spongiiphila]
MHAVEYKGINEMLVKMSGLLLREGRERKTRGQKCYELPEPIMIKIFEPTCRLVTIAARKSNKYLPYAESLWIAGGYNNLDMVGYYLPRMEKFSDDMVTLRGGYGPRIRHCNNSIEDYKIKYPYQKIPNQLDVDQLRFIVECFEKDSNTRQAIISLGDPVKDCFTGRCIKQTKDFPCTRSLHFIKNVDGKLDLHVHMRSNDFIWGATGVNIFNFTFMQEYVSAILKLEIGSYYHVVNNMHYYDLFRCKLRDIAESEYEDIPFEYNKSFNSYDSFIHNIDALSGWERDFREKRVYERIDFEDDFFNDWSAVLYNYHTKNSNKYVNPTLNKLFE